MKGDSSVVSYIYKQNIDFGRIPKKEIFIYLRQRHLQ